jgi:dihydroorotate dehydrogenase electron transfer subunit
VIETISTVESNHELAPGYRHLVLNFEPEFHALPGQFAMLRAHRTYEPLLRRALAFYTHPRPNQASFLYQVLGRGTETLAQLSPGSQVEALLPLGNSWSSPGNQVEAPGYPKRAIVVSGGIGSASVLMLCRDLVNAGADTRVLFGAASRGVAAGCGLKDFQALGLDLTVTTDDGSLGERGFVTGPLERLLAAGEGAGATIYACGPWVMMKRVAEIADRFACACIVSLEAPMGCGFGVCVGCVVAVRNEGPMGYDSYKRVCTDGPVFDAYSIRWDVNALTH